MNAASAQGIATREDFLNLFLFMTGFLISSLRYGFDFEPQGEKSKKTRFLPNLGTFYQEMPKKAR